MRWTASPQPAQALILELILAACSYSLNKSVHLQQHLSTQTTHGAPDQAKGDYSTSIPSRKSKSSPIMPQWQQLSTISSYRGQKFPGLSHLCFSKEMLNQHGEGGSAGYTSSCWSLLWRQSWEVQKGAKLAHFWGQRDKVQVRPCKRMSKEGMVETALLGASGDRQLR